MCKKSLFRLTVEKEHSKRVSTLFKSDGQHLYHIYWSTWRKFSCKNSLLVICKSLTLFVNTMTAVDKCSLPNRDNLMQPIHMQLFQKLKTFSSIFILHFRNLRLNFEHFSKKKMTLIAYWFHRLRPTKNVVRYMLKKSLLQNTLPKGNTANGSHLFLNLSDRTCGIFIAQLERNLVAKSLF